MSSLTPSGTYRERGDRWIEREEARSLREALQEMDLKEEQRLHAAAQKEASELVWRHRAPHAPYQNPDLTKDYKSHLRKGSHARSLTTGRYSDLHMRKQPKVQNDRSVSDSSDSRKSDNDVAQPNSKAVTLPSQETKPNPKKDQTNNAMGHAIWDSPERKAYMNLSFPLPPKSSTRRRSSGQKGRKVSSGSGKGLFKNPEDQIYEEPDEIAIVKPNPENTNSKPLSPTDRNPNFIGRGRRSPFDRSNTAPVEEKRKLSSVEVYKNPPSQSRNPSYMQNALPPTPPDSTSTSESNTSKGRPVSRDGMEVRSDEIRAATSMRLKDRSSKLPTPSVVSDRPGRPIVSFDRGWKAKEADREAGNSSCPSSRNEPSKTLPMPPSKPHLGSMVSAPEIPTINLPDSPSIQLNDSQPLPTINIPNIPSVSVSSFDVPTISPPTSDASSRPLPNPAARSRPTPANRPLPHHSSTTPAPSSHTNRSSLFQRATAQCAACALPIAGRIVSAASQRFHPACFSCFQCGELLECVAFYPEPESFRSSRLARIQARLNGVPISDDEARKYTEEDDGDDGLRFYCHLDFHEKFSPRCRNCKTPIEGEVVVACGGEWHVGHFFCAECGDPFDASTPFVEKNGYAWCVGCHSKRFSGKCAGCRRPIVDMVVKALEREWHEECFCCRVSPTARFTRGHANNRIGVWRQV